MLVEADWKHSEDQRGTRGDTQLWEYWDELHFPVALVVALQQHSASARWILNWSVGGQRVSNLPFCLGSFVFSSPFLRFPPAGLRSGHTPTASIFSPPAPPNRLQHKSRVLLSAFTSLLAGPSDRTSARLPEGFRIKTLDFYCLKCVRSGFKGLKEKFVILIQSVVVLAHSGSITVQRRYYVGSLMKDELTAATASQCRWSILVFREFGIHRSRRTKRISILSSRMIKAQLQTAAPLPNRKCSNASGFRRKQGGFLLSTCRVSHPRAVTVEPTVPW